MKTVTATLLAFYAAANAVFAADALRVAGKVPDVLVHGESASELAQRLGQAVLPIDEIAVPVCATRGFALKTLEKVEANDPMLVQVSQGRPIWHLRVEGSGCGAVRRHNVYLFDQGEQPIKLAAMLPGDTAANLKLQVDALTIVAPAADGMGPKNCAQRTVVIDTKIAQAPKGKAPWSETWIFRKCATDIRFRVTFTPDETGAGISARRE